MTDSHHCRDHQPEVSRRALLGGAALAGAAALTGAGEASAAESATAAAVRPAGTPRSSRAGGMRFGADYVPSKNWWYSWMEWDAKSLLADLQAIAALGLDHIRIQLVWPVFQPDPSVMNTAALDHLRELLDMSGEGNVGLDVEVTVLDGWLSGYDFEPAWRKGAQMITDSSMVTAELRLFDALAEAIGSHPRFLGFDLGNELDVINWNVASQAGDAWASNLLGHCQQIAPGGFHVNGVDQNPWFQQTTFTQAGLATAGSASTFHAWPYWTNALSRYGPTGTGSLHLGEYMAELAKAFHTDLSRPTWMEEFGASPTTQPAAGLPDFAEAFIRNTMSSQYLWGWTWWASHDVDTRFTGFGSFEYQLGLLTIHNEIKPVGERLAQLIRQWRANPPTPAVRTTGLVLADPTKAGLDFADHFFDLIDEGTRPAIVLQDKTNDSSYLAARGITTLVQP